MSDTVISVENISKAYQLGVIGTGTFNGDLQRSWAKLRGLPDPYLKIGEKDHGNRDGDMVWALNDINFTVKQGQAVGIIGRNGAGKSTLLKILSRVTAPTSGVIKVKGRVASLLEVGTGFHPELTGRENIFLNGAILGMRRHEIARKFDEIVDFSGVEKFINTPVKRYSSGMYVRLAFAVAAHLDPDILVVDEVLAVGDAEFQKKCLGKMDNVVNSGHTILFVSHNMGAINNLCERCIYVDKGGLKLDGPTNEVVLKYLDTGLSKNDGEVFLEEIKSDVYFSRVAILNDENRPSGSVPVTKDFKIQFEYIVARETSDFEVAFNLYNSNSSKIFYSGTSKSKTDVNIQKQPGKYVAEVRIPGGLIAPGRYSITASLHRPNITMYDRREAVISLSIVESGSDDYKYLGKDMGSILVQFDWSVNRN